MNSVHGHALLDLLAERPEGFTPEELGATILQRFGSDVCFHTCSRQGLSPEQILQLFFSKGRVIENDAGRLQAGTSCGCGGHGHSHASEEHSHGPDDDHAHGSADAGCSNGSGGHCH